MTNPNFGPNRRQNELGLRSWHREEKSEEALLTHLEGESLWEGHCWATPAGPRPGGSSSFIEECPGGVSAWRPVSLER